MRGSRLIMFLVLLYTYIDYNVSQSPHIIFIVADDLGWNDVSWHTDEILMPNLDTMARAGVILNNSYVQPMCSPSRSAFMSGYFPFHTGLQHDVIGASQANFLESKYKILPQYLKEKGYATHIVGKWHLGFCNWKYTPTYRGFDSYLGYYVAAEDYYQHNASNGYDFRFNTSVLNTTEYSLDVFTRRAKEILTTHSINTPLFLYLPFQNVHAPLEVPEIYEKKFANIQNRNRRQYSGMVYALDEAVGQIMKVLDDQGYMNNSVIMFTTDNGGPVVSGANNLPLRGAKTTIWEGGTRGAAFVYSPTYLHKTQYTHNGLMHAADWFSTILGAAGVDIPDGVDGLNLWDMMSNGSNSTRQEVVHNIDDMYNNSAIRDSRYKLMFGNPGRYNTWYPLPGVDGLCQPVSEITDLPDVQLFDLLEDPGEHYNIADQNPHIVQRLTDRLNFYKKTAIPARYPKGDPESNPDNFGGVWSPGWC
ncbi:hypothetical protein SNE40_003505 [Patella caerulea]